MKKMTIAALLAVTGTALWAALPTVDNIALSQNADTRLVTITYTLNGGPAIVTADICTNGVPVGAARMSSAWGDVNRLVKPGVRSFFWQPRVDLPETVLDANALTVKFTLSDLADPPDYMVVNLTETNSIAFYASADLVPGGVTNRLYKTDRLVMRRIRAACREFIMGTPDGSETGYIRSSAETGRINREIKCHRVTFTNDYYIGIYELTYRQFRRAVNAVPSTYFYADTDALRLSTKADVRPVTGFRWHQWRVSNNFNLITDDAAMQNFPVTWPEYGHQIVEGEGAFLERFRKLTGLELDMPTEAQWEYACRAGSPTALYTGADIGTATRDITTPNGDTVEGAAVSEALDGVAWYAGNWEDDSDATFYTTSGGSTRLAPHEVGLLQPNAFGLYDMLGNVYEICLNAMANQASTSDYDGSDEVEPAGPAATPTSRRAARGGSFNSNAVTCRAGYRLSINSTGTGPTSNLDSNRLFEGADMGIRLVCPAVLSISSSSEGEE